MGKLTNINSAALVIGDKRYEPSDEEIKKEVYSYAFEKAFWEDIANKVTPPELVEIRKGYYDKDLGRNVDLEYFPEEYTLAELNRLFPGWWVAKMKRSSAEELLKLRCVLVEGYLFVPYITPAGKKVRKIWAIAGDDVTFKSDGVTPVSIVNTFKGARTNWLRLSGKWLGIGLDIYHQKITAPLRSMFEDRVRVWRDYAGHWINTAKSCSDGKSFRTMLKIMPSMEQIQRFRKALEHLPTDKHDELWKNFAKLSNASEESKEQFNTWLTKVEAFATKTANHQSTT